jgi:hypothetical protein
LTNGALVSDVTVRADSIKARRAAQAAVSASDLQTLGQKLDALPHEARRAFDVSAHGQRVIGFADLRTAMRALGRSQLGLAVPPGVNRDHLYVSLPGVLSYLTGASKSAQVVFFQADRAGRLTPLDNNGPVLVGQGTSFATPQFDGLKP